jgi:catechol O-methyltransferase
MAIFRSLLHATGRFLTLVLLTGKLQPLFGFTVSLKPSLTSYCRSQRLSMSGGDPFAAFGTDSDDDHEIEPSPQARDPSNGALVFRPGTEQALLQYVKNELQSMPDSSHSNEREQVLRLVDKFCQTRHWMMHVGDKKGPKLEAFLTETLQSYQKDPERSRPFLLVEIGTYCGYSLIRMINTLLKSTFALPSTDFHLITIDVSAQNQAVAKKMARLAGVQDYVSFVLLKDPERIDKELSTAIRSTMQQLLPERPLVIDFLFIDHEKELYLPDLLQLEQAGLIRAKTRVCADNVVYFQLDEYRQHMQDLSVHGIVETRLEKDKLEYLNAEDADLEDGLGKHVDGCLGTLHYSMLISHGLTHTDVPSSAQS